MVDLTQPESLKLFLISDRATLAGICNPYDVAGLDGTHVQGDDTRDPTIDTSAPKLGGSFTSSRRYRQWTQ
jgi:hypothetical protein